MEGVEPFVLRHQQENTRCFVVNFVWFIVSCSIGLGFLIIDKSETGVIEYEYQCPSGYNCAMSNDFTCSHQYIIIDCSDSMQYTCCADICYALDNYSTDIRWHLNDVNQAYDKLYANIYYICLCTVCIVPYVLVSILSLVSGDLNAKCFGIKTKHKCLLLCFVSMIACVVGVIFGVILLQKPNNCGHGLYEYIQAQIDKKEQFDTHYKWTNDSPQLKIGATLVFLMVNVGITLIFTLYFCQNSLRSYRPEQHQAKRYGVSIFAEGLLQRFSVKSATKYGSANPAMYSINAHTEGV